MFRFLCQLNEGALNEIIPVRYISLNGIGCHPSDKLTPTDDDTEFVNKIWNAFLSFESELVETVVVGNEIKRCLTLQLVVQHRELLVALR